ncbi:hypothetical protein PAAG_12464 [Paracoccidioides lutzii Pb01]|uniref:Secreted protein n=1 Tax=Paracoccidioides lutzii (strain ATCC MYA-826 / Pb01) TaxID=502779 RepID=A0A0A2V3Y9_PARBA|nr:hypothetical protein PAAG_12464 [Paracoccidioides lutzii Pb01]KGQ00875.1 hypothetical protein PAAG_12464 [Paracoccidioides lutzii Pb01]
MALCWKFVTYELVVAWLSCQGVGCIAEASSPVLGCTLMEDRHKESVAFDSAVAVISNPMLEEMMSLPSLPKAQS